MDRRCTIKDLAMETGVSTATISRFLNKSGYVDAETGKKIEQAIIRLKYKPDRTAQALKTKKSKQIMLIVSDICNPFYSSTAKIVQSIAKDKGYTVILYNTNDNVNEEINSIQTALSVNTDGIILCSIYVKDEVIHELKKAGRPVVVGSSYEECPFDSVYGIQGEGTYLTTKHLLDLGHRRIAFAGGVKESATALERKLGYLNAITEAGIEFNSDYCFEMGFSEDSGYKAGKYFSTLNPLPTAICCANDLIAMGVLIALNECNIKVPDDISVTGMDNILYASLCRPGLTTVTNDSIEFGRNVSELLFDRIEGNYEGPARRLSLSRKLIIRESTRRLCL